MMGIRKTLRVGLEGYHILVMFFMYATIFDVHTWSRKFTTKKLSHHVELYSTSLIHQVQYIVNLY